ncbi:MAG TPA: hypothetical protein VFM55_26010 [Micromonosporaceae bacterium]|nr:hypothetical protein [Micromonosporaceae bacterium]
MSFSWDAVSALSSIAGTALVLAAAWIALYQFRESVSTRQLQSIIASIEQLQSSSLRNVRWFLRYNHEEIKGILEGSNPLEQLNRFLADPDHPGGSPKSIVGLRTSMAVLEFLSVLSLNNKIPIGLEQ